jgi:CheY-like chemotaxis protein
MDGFELLSIMQEDERLRTIPVVVMTANDTNEIAANCLSKFNIILTFYDRNGR